jgi:hypothetical protein
MREFRRIGNILNARTVWGVGMKIVTFLLLSFSLLAQTKAGGNSGPKSALDKATLEAYLRYSELWVPQVAVKIDDPKPSADLNNFFDVWVHLSYNGSTKDELYYVSKDGKNIVHGTAYDVAKSPFEANVAQLKMDQHPSYGAGPDAPVKLIVFGDFQCPVCQKEAHVIGSLGNGQTIQTGAVLRDDGSGGIHRLRRDRVLHPPRGSR